MATIAASNGSLTDFYLPLQRLHLDAIVSINLKSMGKAFEELPVDALQQTSYDDVLDLIGYMRGLSIANNARIILSNKNLFSFLLNEALLQGKDPAVDQGGVAAYMVRHTKELLYYTFEVNNSSGSTQMMDGLVVRIVKNTLASHNLAETKPEGNEILDLVKATVSRLEDSALDLSGTEIEKSVLSAYKKASELGLLPEYVSEYLDSIGIPAEQQSPEIKKGMLEYLLSLDLEPGQYGDTANPWDAQVEEIKATKADAGEITRINTELGLKAPTSEIARIDTELGLKAPTSEITRIDAELGLKAPTSEIARIDAELAKKANTEKVNQIERTLATKADGEAIGRLSAEIQAKADRSALEALTLRVQRLEDAIRKLFLNNLSETGLNRAQATKLKNGQIWTYRDLAGETMESLKAKITIEAKEEDLYKRAIKKAQEIALQQADDLEKNFLV